MRAAVKGTRSPDTRTSIAPQFTLAYHRTIAAVQSQKIWSGGDVFITDSFTFALALLCKHITAHGGMPPAQVCQQVRK